MAINLLDLEKLYSLQAELDEEIAQKHGVSYESTFNRRLLALLVELGELANETRSFKYWSNKKIGDFMRIKDEYADGLHFSLSLGIYLKANKFIYQLEKSDKDLSLQLLDLYKLAIALKDNYDLGHYYQYMQNFLNLALSLNMSEEDIVDAYLSKLKVNHIRQDNNY